MSDASNEKSAVLAFLKAGGSLRYFAVAGGVAGHEANGTPSKQQTCSISTFLKLREEKLIDLSDRNVTGYPYYANNHRADVYKITDTGREATFDPS